MYIRSVGIEDCALGTANPLRDKALVVDSIAKIIFAGLWKRRTVLRDDAQRNDATPGPIR